MPKKHPHRDTGRIARRLKDRLREAERLVPKPTADTRRFTLPPFDTPEPGPPPTIVHGCDYMLRDDGWYEFRYDYLDYHWRVGGQDVRARHYLGRSVPLTVSVTMTLSEFDRPPYGHILAYLQRRFEVIQTLEPEGITVCWMLA